MPLRFYFAHAIKPSVQRAAKTVETEEGRSLNEYLREPTRGAASNRAAMGSKERDINTDVDITNAEVGSRI